MRPSRTRAGWPWDKARPAREMPRQPTSRRPPPLPKIRRRARNQIRPNWRTERTIAPRRWRRRDRRKAPCRPQPPNPRPQKRIRSPAARVRPDRPTARARTTAAPQPKVNPSRKRKAHSKPRPRPQTMPAVRRRGRCPWQPRCPFSTGRTAASPSRKPPRRSRPESSWPAYKPPRFSHSRSRPKKSKLSLKPRNRPCSLWSVRGTCAKTVARRISSWR